MSNFLRPIQFSPIAVALLSVATSLSVAEVARGQTATTGALPQSSRLELKQSRVTSAVLGQPLSPTLERSGPTAIAPPDVILAQDPGETAPTTPQQETPDTIPLTPDGPTPPPPVQPETPNTGAETPAAPTTTPADETPADETPTETPPTGDTPTDETPAEARVLVAEVVVSGVEGELQNLVYDAIQTQPGRTTTRSQLQADINAIFQTGRFANVRAIPEDTPLGVRITFEVEVNPILQAVRLEGTTVLPDSVIEEAFSDQYGQVLNLNELNEGIKVINQWYQDNGYVLAQVLESPQVSPDGIVTLQVAEGVIENIQVRFIDKDGNTTDAEGNPIRGRTREYIVLREFEQKPGDVFNRDVAQRDLQRAFGLGIFEDVRLSLNPGEDPRKVVLVANVVQKSTGNLGFGAGISSASGLFGTVSYQQQNVGGNNQKLGVEFQLGERQLLFDLNFTDPWIGGDPYRTSYTVNLFRRRTISLIFDGGDPDIRLPGGDRPRVVRTGGGISFSRPLSKDVFRQAEWRASLGLQYQRVSIRDDDGDLAPQDQLGNDLSFSGEGRDDLLSLQFGIVRDRRNDPLRPTQGSLLRFGTEQSIPVGLGNIFYNRLRASYSYYIPVRFLQFTSGCREETPSAAQCPQALAFNIQGGTIVGDLPPYEAFSLGGSNSVRGYDEGELGSARSFIQATIEYRFPIFSIISGAFFVDAATSLGSQDSVPGDPGGIRGKPGEGFGYGLGLRVQSPLGPIRIDYGINDNGESRLHFGIGERF